jgi:hypothetical protein
LQATTSPFINVVELYVELFVPVGAPLRVHAYKGVAPPFVIAAVKLIGPVAPEHPVALGLVSAIVGATDGFTVIVIELLTARLDAAQAWFVVTSQVITSPFCSVLDV